MCVGAVEICAFMRFFEINKATAAPLLPTLQCQWPSTSDTHIFGCRESILENASITKKEPSSALSFLFEGSLRKNRCGKEIGQCPYSSRVGKEVLARPLA